METIKAAKSDDKNDNLTFEIDRCIKRANEQLSALKKILKESNK